MNLSMIGGVTLVVVAVAASVSSSKGRRSSMNEPVEVEIPAKPKLRSHGSSDIEVESPSGWQGRRPLGGASLATQGRPSLQRVTVGGFVRWPGPLSIHGERSVREVILRAGGAGEFGSLRRVKVIRGGKVYHVDLTDEEAEPMMVQSGDSIEVSQKMLLGR